MEERSAGSAATPERKIAFVTGGTGFIGSHLAEALLERGYDEVRCLVRKDLKWLEGTGVTLIRGDLSDVSLLWDVLQGVNYVYHVAGVTRATDWDTFEKGNILATLNLLGAVRMAAPDVRKVLVTSSLAAVGRCPSGIADESTPLNPISRYGRSKAEMEQRLTAPNKDGWTYADSLPLVVVRPPAVYGPREADIFTFFKTVSSGICPIVGGSRVPALSLVHVRDLVRGMIDAAESHATTGKTYFLGGPAQYSWDEVKQATLATMKRRALTIRVPGPLIGIVGAAAELAGKLTGTYPPLNREKAREIRYTCKMCIHNRAEADFGYRARVPLDEGMTETIAWYREHGWL
jgi:dihydroflavonol-4-reductase